MHDCEAYSLAFVFPHPSTNLTKFTSLPRFSISFSSFLLLVNLLHFGVFGLLRRTDGMGTSDMIWGMAWHGIARTRCSLDRRGLVI